MKKIIFTTIFTLLSFNSFAEAMRPALCYTTGECVESNGNNQEQVCFSVKTGYDSTGASICAPKCLSMPVTFTCVRFTDKPYGRCEKEVLPFSTSDTGSGSCNNGSIEADEAPFAK